jgi:hypothetical protein
VSAATAPNAIVLVLDIVIFFLLKAFPPDMATAMRSIALRGAILVRIAFSYSGRDRLSMIPEIVGHERDAVTGQGAKGSAHPILVNRE